MLNNTTEEVEYIEINNPDNHALLNSYYFNSLFDISNSDVKEKILSVIYLLNRYFYNSNGVDSERKVLTYLNVLMYKVKIKYKIKKPMYISKVTYSYSSIDLVALSIYDLFFLLDMFNPCDLPINDSEYKERKEKILQRLKK